MEIPDSLLTIEKEPVLMPVYAPGFSCDSTTNFGSKMTSYIEGIRLMCVEIQVIKMITNEVIPKMSLEERTQLNEDLLEINEVHLEKSECAFDLSKILEDHFPEDPALAAML